jgi:hypothetical protein
MVNYIIFNCIRMNIWFLKYYKESTLLWYNIVRINDWILAFNSWFFIINQIIGFIILLLLLETKYY